MTIAELLKELSQYDPSIEVRIQDDEDGRYFDFFVNFESVFYSRELDSYHPVRGNGREQINIVSLG
jgi:hypothetical protein